MLPAEGDGDTWTAPLAGTAGCVALPGLPELPGWVPGAVPPSEAPEAPGTDDPSFSALSRPWWPPSPPVSARTVSTAAAATTAAAALPWVWMIRPKLALLISLIGFAKLVWLRTLKKSARACKCRFSQPGMKVLAIAKS